MNELTLDWDILKLIEEQPEISDRAIAENLSVPEDIVKARIASFQDTREKILLVNDGPDALKGLKQALEAEDYNVVEAADGFSALDAAKAGRPDLVLLDLMLPGVDGFEVCRQLKASPRCGQVPVVMLGAPEGVDAIIRGFETGADDYVTKPVDLRELKARIRMVLRRTWA